MWGWLCGDLAAIADTQIFSIAAARQQPAGTEVVVTGIITVPSQHFASANEDQGFALEDETGGIYITTPLTTDFQLGQTLKVIGVLMDDGHGQRMVELRGWQVQDQSVSAIVPRLVTIREAGKNLDGRLVKVQGTITQPLENDTPYGDRLWIQDDTGSLQVYIPKSTPIHPETMSFLQPGNKVRVTGLSSQFDDSDEVIPRLQEDIELISDP